MSELEKYDSRDVELERLGRLGNAKRDCLADYLHRSRLNEEKTAASENLLASLTDRFAALKSAKLDAAIIYGHCKVEITSRISGRVSHPYGCPGYQQLTRNLHATIAE